MVSPEIAHPAFLRVRRDILSSATLLTIVRASLNKFHGANPPPESSPRLLGNTLHLLTIVVHTMREAQSRERFVIKLPKHDDGIYFGTDESAEFWKSETMSSADFAAAVMSNEPYMPSIVVRGLKLGSEASMTSSCGEGESDDEDDSSTPQVVPMKSPDEDRLQASILTCLLALFSEPASVADKSAKRSIHWLIRAIACIDPSCRERIEEFRIKGEELYAKLLRRAWRVESERQWSWRWLG